MNRLRACPEIPRPCVVSVAGFGEGVVIATPKIAQIHKPIEKKKEKADFIGQPGLM